MNGEDKPKDSWLLEIVLSTLLLAPTFIATLSTAGRVTVFVVGVTVFAVSLFVWGRGKAIELFLFSAVVVGGISLVIRLTALLN